jgi:phosphoserine phosphatase
MVGVIDFDGTFLKNDYFKELFFKKMLENPLFLLNHFLFKRKDLLSLKFELLKDLSPEYEIDLLINQHVKTWIKENRKQYTKLVLVSASPDFFVKKILSKITYFDEIHGSADINLKGLQKLHFIQENFGNEFDYLGDSNADVPIFKHCRNAFKITHKGIIHVS